jgi:hypothetical protein
METATQRRVPVGEISKPTGAAASVFDIGTQAKAAAKAERQEVDMSALQIRKGVPIPEAQRGPKGGRYKDLLDRMQPGDSVVLSSKAAHSMVAAAKKLGVKIANRKLGDGKNGIWKL